MSDFSIGKNMDGAASERSSCLIVSPAPLNTATSPYAYSVILPLYHSRDRGTLGVNVARTHEEVLGDIPALSDRIRQPWLASLPLSAGGPIMQTQLWFLTDQKELLPQPDFQSGGHRFTRSLRCLDALSDSAAPARLKVGIGHVWWRPGQLEQEVHNGRWWILPPDAVDIYSRPWWILYPDCLDAHMTACRHRMQRQSS